MGELDRSVPTDLAIRTLAAPVLAPKSLKRVQPSAASSSTTPLLDMENAEKQRWAKRLSSIAERAAVHADPDRGASSDGILSAEEKARLQLLVFTSGAPSTMANHMRRFEKFERWAHRSGLDFYPITDDKVLKYAMDLDARDCGPTVLPSFRTAIRWVAFRVNFKIPSIDTAAMKALEKDVFTKRGKPLKEAIPFEIELVEAMERFVVQATYPTPARIFMWWVLCMIFASLRFDDAIHVKPHELEVRPEGLFGVSWQTKTERKRRGTKFVVPDVSFSKCAWFKVGLDLFDLEFPLVEGDFWIPEMENKTTVAKFSSRVCSFTPVAPSSGVARGQGRRCLAGDPGQGHSLTWHSARVTALQLQCLIGVQAKEKPRAARVEIYSLSQLAPRQDDQGAGS